MYFTKTSLKELYLKMSTLYSGEDIEAQGGTQFVSEMKYFLAMDEFYFFNKKACDTNINSDRNKFIEYVGNIVLLSDPEIPNRFYTKNFSKNFGNNSDFDIGSNFFSVNAVKNSKTSNEPISFPSRHPRLLICNKGEISLAEDAYKNFSSASTYFGSSLQQKATILLFWLNRNTKFQSSDSMYNDFIAHIKNHHTEKLIQSLTFETQKCRELFESVKSTLSFDNKTHYLTSDDFLQEKPIFIQKTQSTDLKAIFNELGKKYNFNTNIEDNGDFCIPIKKKFLLEFNTECNIIVFSLFEKQREEFKKEIKQLIDKNKWAFCSPEDEYPNKSCNDYNQYEKIIGNICIYAKIKDSEELSQRFMEFVNIFNQFTQSSPSHFSSDSTHKTSQLIYYGVPGCGKSNKIYETLKDVADFNKIRTVFHPEYTNADFIGQILPKTDEEKISYKFTPGPFTEILDRSYQKPEEHFYLIIEEINRGNAAAIFGDVFQILDRNDNGESQYSIHNKDIGEYLQRDEIRLPPNLSIIATMNTSDQNVFTLDNAFQRRFDMVLVRSGVTRKPTVNHPSSNPDDYNFELNDKNIQNQFNATIEGTDISWGIFWDWINFKITETLRGLSSTEDKRLGLWFVKNAGGKIPRKIFAEKVLKYLWDDAFKFKRKEIFSNDILSLESLISAVEDSTDENILSRIFKNYPENGSN